MTVEPHSLEIKVQLDQSFDECMRTIAAAILRRIAERLQTADAGRVVDPSGNTIGEWKFVF